MSFYQDFKELIFPSLTEFSQQVFKLNFHIKIEFIKYPLLYPSSRILIRENLIKRRDHQVFQICIWRNCIGCGLGKLAGSRVLFLWEQVRDLQVQEFLRELFVGVTAPSDLTGSIIVEILHSGEGGT